MLIGRSWKVRGGSFPSFFIFMRTSSGGILDSLRYLWKSGRSSCYRKERKKKNLPLLTTHWSTAERQDTWHSLVIYWTGLRRTMNTGLQSIKTTDCLAFFSGSRSLFCWSGKLCWRSNPTKSDTVIYSHSIIVVLSSCITCSILL